MIDPNEHLLALKVMRLTRPTLVSPQIITAENTDLPQNTLNNVLKKDITSVEGNETIAAGQFMLLPQSFGNIYLGETFSSYVCVHNTRSHPVNSVRVKADLQSNSSRINLPIHANKTIPVTLTPEETLDDVIHHEVKEIGTHILVCEVSYVTPAGLETSFRKFFKFQVVKPLDVKTKFYNAETDEVYLEAQIQNITAGPICLEKVELESTEQYTVTSLNNLPNGESVFCSKNMLQPLNSCQFLYCIKPIAEIANDPKALKDANNIGKLDIVWRSNLGERGRLQTSQLQRSAKNRFTQVNGENYHILCKVMIIKNIYLRKNGRFVHCDALYTLFRFAIRRLESKGLAIEGKTIGDEIFNKYCNPLSLEILDDEEPENLNVPTVVNTNQEINAAPSNDTIQGDSNDVVPIIAENSIFQVLPANEIQQDLETVGSLENNTSQTSASASGNSSQIDEQIDNLHSNSTLRLEQNAIIEILPTTEIQQERGFVLPAEIPTTEIQQERGNGLPAEILSHNDNLVNNNTIIGEMEPETFAHYSVQQNSEPDVAENSSNEEDNFKGFSDNELTIAAKKVDERKNVIIFN